ncbi:MAG: transcription antitermination factor NusB [Clostridia bacterium]|nr:transcription antitermination factor NusB [Clostridia bacterium]
MNRREARISAFCLLFESDFHPECTFEEIYLRAGAVGELKINSFAKNLYETVVSNKSEIDKTIEASSNKWKISRFSTVTRAIVRLAVGEIMFTDVPAKVAINEAVEIAKVYDDDKATSFINGVLNNISRNLGKIED